MAQFNEDSRVKIPTILHLMKLGYSYLSLKTQDWDESTNIFKNIFIASIARLNPELETKDIDRFYDEIALSLENEDLGRAFYEKLIDESGIRMIDFENFHNNTLNVVTELTYKKDDEEFRPDIILLINGMPLAFIEVKKPNNREGIIAEHKRIKTRFENKKFRNFVNITQLMVFSNNMEYDDSSPQPIKGAFYATSSYQKPVFNYFREEVTTNQGFKSVIPDKVFSTAYIFYTIKNLIPVIINNAVGSTFKEVSGSTLKSIKTILPENNVLDKFNSQMKTIFKRQDLLEIGNEKLSSLRDWLLPMLMNGQVRVRETEEIVSSSAETSQSMAAAERGDYK